MSRVISSKMLVVAMIFIGTGLILLLRLFYIQVVDDQYKLYANDNVLRYVTEYPARGLLFDRQGKLLAYNEPAYDLMVIPRQVKDLDTTAFCELIGLKPVVFVKRLKDARSYSPYKASVIEKNILSNPSAIIREKLFKFPGFFLQPRTLRKYPDSLAGHVLGYVGEVDDKILARDSYYKAGDYIGVSGIEHYYETVLRGQRGLKVRMVDVHNRVVGSFENGAYDTLSVPGKNIHTTLDATLQAYGEHLMANKMGSIVAIEPSTGEILALVTAPVYNPNLLVGRERTTNYNKLVMDSLKPLYNRATMANYPPGSTFKLVNALVGLQEGVVVPSTSYGCQRGFHFGGLTVGCHAHTSPLNLVQSIQHSCNAYYCRVFKSIIDPYPTTEKGYNAWRDHVTSFGLGASLGTDMDQDLKGLVPKAEYYDRYHGKGRWKSLSVISLAIGQGELGVTPLQMANLGATIANRGYYYIPHIVKSVEGRESIDEKYMKPIHTTIDSSHFKWVIEGMEKVVQAGTASRAKVEGIAICGKTGTAQNPHGEDHSIFMAFAPKDEPRIAIVVYVENAGFGSSWAAPIATLMIEKYLKGEVSRKDLEKRMIETHP
ncbi:MAG: penicillin-binding protein 2 [Flavobacteriales bacterium]|nr:penicillin-binding protein 2 [Flavobacteriales bacterium]